MTDHKKRWSVPPGVGPLAAPYALAEGADGRHHRLPRLAERPDFRRAAFQVIENNGFGGAKLRGGVSHVRSDLERDGGDTVAVGMHQVARLDGQTADANRAVQVH